MTDERMPTVKGPGFEIRDSGPGPTTTHLITGPGGEVLSIVLRDESPIHVIPDLRIVDDLDAPPASDGDKP